MKRMISLILILVFVFPCFVIPTLAEESSSHVTETSGNGYALYNGVKLPNIDSVWTDKETYPYACIFDIGIEVSGAYTVAFCSENPYIATVDGVLSIEYVVGSTMTDYAYAPDTTGVNGWVVNRDPFVVSADYGSSPLSDYPIIWSSADILNQTDNTTYLSAFDPIPLDGMTVIEWDGVTDGLTCFEHLGMYKVSSATPSATELVGSVSIATSSSGLEAIVFDESYINSSSVAPCVVIGNALLFVPEDSLTICGITVPEKGIYMMPDVFFFAYTPATTEEEEPTTALTAPSAAWAFDERELIVSEYHPIVGISNIGAAGQCVLYSRSVSSDGTTSEWTAYMTDEVLHGDTGIDMCAFDLYPDESQIPYSMQYKAVVTLGSGDNTVTAETDVVTIHWVLSATVDPSEPTIDGGGSSGDVDSDDDVPMLQAIWQAITDGFNNVGVWFSTLFKLLQDGASVSDIQEVLGSIGDLQEDVNQLPNDITSGMENVIEQEQVKAEGQGNESANEIVQIIPDPSADFIGSLQTLTTVLNYEGTACVLTMPAITIPSVGGLFREFTLLDEQQIDFEYWVNMMPPELIIIVRALFDIAIVGYCIKEFLDLVGGAVNGFGEGFTNQIAGD